MAAPYYWSRHSGGALPQGATVCGRDKDGADMFVGRVMYEGDMLPAKIVPNKGGAFFSYGGAEHSSMDYEALAGSNLVWQGASGGQVPPDSITVGQTSSGEPLYVGRVLHDGTLTLGKVHPSHGVCYIPYGGQELPFTSYEVLVSK